MDVIVQVSHDMRFRGLEMLRDVWRKLNGMQSFIK